MRILLTTLILLILSFTNSHSQWHPTNGPEGGIITCITSNGNDFFAGAGIGGIYYSDNNGENWQSINTPLTSRNFIGNFAFKGDDIFAATTTGVLFSSDKGKNWELKNNGLTNLYLNGIIRVNDYLICSSDKIAKSSDWGNSWVSINTGFEIDSNPVRIASKDNVLYAGLMSKTLGGNIQGGGIYKSTNMGEDWSLIGLDKITIYKIEISGDTIFTVTSDGFYISSDNGNTWLSKSDGIEDELYSFARSDNYYFAGTLSDIYISSNHGNNWIKSNFTNTYIWSLSEIGGKIYASTGEGIFSTSDNGINWVKNNNGIISTEVSDIISFNDKIFAGTYENGLVVTYNQGDEWETVDIDTSEQSFYKLSVHNDTIFALIYRKGKILKSIDKGVSWKALSPINSSFIKDLIVIGNKYIVSSGTGLHISENQGEDWVQYDTYYYSNLKKIGNVIYASSRLGLYMSKDEGLNWEYASTDLKDTSMNLTFMEFIDNTFYVQDKNNGFIISKDLGKTWYSPKNNNFPASTKIFSCITYGTKIFVSTYKSSTNKSGILLSTDEGENWKEINDGLTNTLIFKFLIKDDSIYAATSGAGVFKAKISDFDKPNSVENKIEDRNYLYANPPFPLPAINEVRSLIYWDTDLEINVEQIAVYNIYGVKVAGHDKIRLDKLTAYSGNLVWDCSGVESGLYVIHLKHGTESRIIKVIVTK